MKIAIIYGHPNPSSYCYALANAYVEGAMEAGAMIRKIELANMDFDPVLKFGYKQRMEEEADLVWAKESILWADHLVFVYPMWWGTMPSLLKGFIDRVFTPGYAFKYIKGSYFNEKLLSGKSARVIVTSDAPTWYAMFTWRNMAKIQMKKTILGYCGVGPIRFTQFGSVKWKKPAQLEKWISKVNKFGKALK